MDFLALFENFVYEIWESWWFWVFLGLKGWMFEDFDVDDCQNMGKDGGSGHRKGTCEEEWRFSKENRELIL